MVTPTLFLHIGGPKTGTSLLQVQFAKNVDALLAHNILYPEHFSLAAARRNHITSGNGVPVAKMLGAPLPDTVTTDHIYEEISAAYKSGRNILYSSESMSAMKISEASKFRDMVEEIGYRIIIIFYFRSIADLALSGYSQIVKQAMTSKNFAGYLREDYNTIVQELIAKTICSVFGNEKIIFRNYDGKSGFLFQDFLQRNLNISEISGFDISDIKINRSLTALETIIMREANPVLSSSAQGRIISDAMIFRDPDAKPVRTISSEAFAILESRALPTLRRINEYLPQDPISLKSSALDISDEPEPELSEVERVLAGTLAGLVRFGGLSFRLD